MPEIELKDLNHSIGTELFADDESFLEDLNDDAGNIIGGAGIMPVNTILNEPTALLTTRADVPLTTRADFPQPTPPVPAYTYNPNPGGNSGINCTGFYTTGYNPHKPRRHRRPKDGFTIDV
jgi:hypothetical protein